MKVIYDWLIIYHWFIIIMCYYTSTRNCICKIKQIWETLQKEKYINLNGIAVAGLPQKAQHIDRVLG